MIRAGWLLLALLAGGLVSLVAPGWLAVLVAVAVAGMAAIRRSRGPVDDDVASLVQTAHAFGQGDRGARAALDDSSSVADLGLAFDAMAERIAGMMEAREELLAAVSHELRTPLNRLRFGIEILEGVEDRAKRGARIEALQQDIEELDDLVRELLTWGRLDSVRAVLVMESIDLQALGQRMAEEAKALGAKDVRVDVPQGLRLRAEPRLLKRAWRNGVTNAVRYGGGTVVIGASGDGGTSLWVDDDGPGVPEAQREAVFDPFVRLDVSRSSSTGGTGLGLALVARIADAHGGQATIEESPLGGARLRITL